MKRYLVGIGLIITFLLASMIGCGGAKGVPTIEQAQYVITSEQAPGNGMLVYANSYTIKEGVLYLRDGYYVYSSGWTFSPTYKYYKSEIAFTDFSVRARDE